MDQRQDIDRPGDHQSQNHEAGDRLHGHSQFGPAGERLHARTTLVILESIRLDLGFGSQVHR
jgi:hypothetical protein